MSTLASLKRRRLYIDKNFQTKFIFVFLCILILGAIISTILIFYTTQKTLTSSYTAAGLAIEKTSLAILPSVILTNIITTSVIGIFVLIVTLIISHKISGPMFRFEQDLKEIADGDLQKRIHIRSGDQFKEMVINLNGMIESFNKKLNVINHELDVLRDKAEEEHVSQSVIDGIMNCKQTLNSQFRL